jgi:hypothetical protein
MSSLSSTILELDEPSERLKRRTNMDLTPPSNKRRAMPTCLNQLDALTLSHIFDKLTTKELLPLLCLGNWLFATKITAQVKSLNFNYETLRLILPWKKENIIQWRWPHLLTQPLPHLTRLNVDYRVVSTVTARLDLLPISLTQLSLSNCLICVESLHQVIFNLPLLHALSISFVSVNQIGHGLQMPVCDDQWLIPSIQHSPLLTHVAYKMGNTPSFHSLTTIASLTNLEFLSIPHFLIDETCWPPQLSSLQLFNEGEVVSIPSTIPRLQLPPLSKHLETILAMTPETLLHFEMPVGESNWSDRLIPSICCFRHLQTLNLIVMAYLNVMNLMLATCPAYPARSTSYPSCLRPNHLGGGTYLRMSSLYRQMRPPTEDFVTCPVIMPSPMLNICLISQRISITWQ